ncbi:Ca-activated chloride channel family protein [Kordia periserrulae]|uniref:Ca-activated chloride channel family protein n=1 Tax=Kordia periserrulae TaxID=701523 RepID=A0A2T6C1X7_9FLAO|nr:VIT and VWA domain-containing protein [Kordia periserrulae]PTX62324.1 Ca-activated chloride channel family protein [Kordia periserrulae]
MKHFCIFLLLLISISSFAQKTESPYLEILTPNAVIPLKSTKANVKISGNIAHVHIAQTYQNTGNTPIEAKYLFPLSTQAAVHKMQMTIGNRTINAQIFEKQEAQRVYDKALKAGKRAAKLDQQRPNVFQMNVGNILKNDLVTIDIYYTEMLVPLAGSYEFVFPGVVGPRYTGENTSGETNFNQPYTKKGIADTFDYDINVQINSGIPIADVSSNTHDINVHYPITRKAEISLTSKNQNPSNRDFILRYSMRGREIQSGLLLYEENDEQFFAYMMEPPKASVNMQTTAKEYLFVVDVSGSMNGYPMEVSKKLLRNLLVNLPETDHYNILFFAGGSSTLSNTPLPCTPENIQKGVNFLSNIRGGGGTNLLNALKKAYALPRMDETSARSMIVITDGYVSVEREAFEMIETNLGQANVFTFGIGAGVNRYLIEGMAKVSNSESFIATEKNEADAVAEKFRNYIKSPLLTQIRIKADGFNAYDVTPSSIPDVFASRPILVFGKYKGDAKGRLTITGHTGNGVFQKEFNISDGVLSKDNEALKYLWARKKIERLDDYKRRFRDNTKQEVIKLGLQYNLVTQYTSFVAVDHEVVNKNGKQITVKQPLPMPKNVNNSAVGAAASVKGKTFIKRKKRVAIAKADTKNLNEKATVWFRENYTKIIKKYLKTYDGIRVEIAKDGTIVKVEILINGSWILNEVLLERINLLDVNEAYHFGQKVTITLKNA